MKNSRRITSRAVLAIFLVSVSILTASAEDKYVKGKEPVFPAVQPDHALVYFARPAFVHLIPLPTFKVFVDGTPAGWLPQRSYLAVQIEPGRGMVWGAAKSKPQWFEFKAGKTYLLLLVETYGTNRVLYETSWTSGDPADARGLVLSRKLSYVTPTEEAMAKLREEGAKEFEKQEKRAPDTAAATLPATFETVWYRPGKRGFSLRAYESTGTLTVSSETIEYKSDKKTITIPVKAIQAVSLDYVGKFDQANRWGIVRYSAEGSEEVVAFRDGHKLGLAGDTDRIYLTLRSTVQSPRGSEAIAAANQSSREQPKQEGAAPEEQVVVTFDQRKWHVGYETEKGGQRIKEFVLPEETVDNWTELVTIQSFPGAQERMTAEEVVLRMKQRLNACPKAMWKIIQGDKDEFLYEWQTVDCHGWDNQYEVSKIIKGRTAIHRIAYANRKLPIPEETRGLWIDLIGKAGFPAPRSVVQSTEVSTPQQPEKATAVPGEFVVYEGLKDQFTIAIPGGWEAYDQSQLFKGVPGLYGIVMFLPAPAAQELKAIAIPRQMSKSDVTELALKALDVLRKADTGVITSFMVERVRAERGMSCSGFSEKAEKKLLQTIGRDPIFGKGRNVPERPHADPTTVGGCKGLKIRGRGQTSGGAESVVDIYAASDAQTLYLFTLRPLAENYAKNLSLFEKAVSTVKFSAAK